MAVINGTSSNDILTGTTGNDTLSGGDGNDILNGAGGNDTLLGGNGDDSLIAGNGSERLDGGAGIDTADYSQIANGVSLDLTVGKATHGAHTDTVRSVETVIGTQFDDFLVASRGDDAFHQNGGTDTLIGGAGDDELRTNGGADTLVGGTGNDVFVVDNSNAVVVEGAGEGNDTVIATVDYTLAAGSEIEELIVQSWDGRDVNGTGNELDNIIVGDGGNNRLSGAAGNDRLDGQDGNDVLDGGIGDDTMIGGTGDDTFVVDNTGDVVVENANEGTDTVQSSISYTLGDNLENLTLTGSANIDGTGNAQDNVITGNAGDNVLDGGAGADVLTGGAGNDTYIIGESIDTVVENAGEGVDTVRASISYTLTENVENLTLTGADNISGTGNAQDNLISGNSGDNILDGGAGNDTLTGGGGHDTLLGGAGDDTLVAGQGGEILDGGTGIDAVDYSQAASGILLNLTVGTTIFGDGTPVDTVRNVETVIGTDFSDSLIASRGDDDFHRAGGTQTLFGGAGNDFLNTNGGADTLVGGTGDDLYVLDNANAKVIEEIGGGRDAIISSTSYALAAGSEIEELILRTPTGLGDIDGTGNEFDNILVGGGGKNRLSGGAGADTIDGQDNDDIIDGGTGADRMIGGTGNDTFVVDNVGDVVVENAGEGNDTVQSSISFALGANIENLVLTGADDINGAGNGQDNVITGNAGINVLTGGAGNDTYIVQDTADAVVENAGEGVDTVLASASYTLGGNVENLILTGTANINGTGNGQDNVISGNTGDNVLDGGAGNDTLAGGGGRDTLLGGDGNDTLVAGQGGERLDGGAGIDTVDYSQATAGFTTNLTLGVTIFDNHTPRGDDLSNIETVIGSQFNDTLIASRGGDQFHQSGGTDTLFGGGGNDVLQTNGGADTLVGGTGDDLYVIDNANAQVIEAVGGGRDAIISSVSYTLAAGSEIEELILRTPTGLGDIDGTGNEFDNIIVGGGGRNRLNGAGGDDTIDGQDNDDVIDGGTGADRMTGGAGNDTFIVDNTGDVVQENAGEGNDTVQSSISYTLGANVENLVLTGSDNIEGTGNAQGNAMTGNAGNNTLAGGAGDDTLNGGGGIDTLVGGAGSDTYQFSAAGQETIVNGAAGNAGPSGELDFLSGITSDRLWFEQVGNDLRIDVMGTDSAVTISGWFSSTTSQLQEITAGGQHIDSQVGQLVQAMAAYSADHGGFDPAAAANTQVPADADLQTALATAWHS